MRTVPLYRATLTITRTEFGMGDEGEGRGYVNETNQITLDSVEVTLADPQSALTQLIAIAVTKLEKGVLSITFEEPPADNTSKLVRPSTVDEYRDESGETDAEWAARQVEKRQAIRKNEAEEKAEADARLNQSAKAYHAEQRATKARRDQLEAKRPVPYTPTSLIRDEDDDEDEDYPPRMTDAHEH